MHTPVSFQNVQTLCLPGGAVNEDSLSVGSKYLMALDGASGLFGTQLTSAGSDAQWLAQRGAEEIRKRLTHSDVPLPALCRQAAEVLHREFSALSPEPIPHQALPSAGLAVLRLRDDRLEYYGLGDLTTLLRHRDGHTEVVHEGTISRLDNCVLAEMVRLAREQGTSVAAQRASVQSLLQANREQRNRPGGYWIFDPSADGANQGVSLSWPAGDISSVAILSDGMADCVPIYGMAPDYGAFLNRLQQEGPEPLYQELRALQHADPEFDRFPRFKLGDDVTAIVSDIIAI